METLRRVYVGGISPLVTKAELQDRFGKFGRIDDVDIICRKDAQGNPIKTFAYLNINISDVDLKKCISVLNKTKWKGGILQIEKAKESFLHRLSKERQEAKEEGANAPCLQNDIVLSLEKAGVTDFLMKFAVPGTEVPNHKNWVVSKFGRVLPVLHLNGKNQSKIMKYDPSKYCHNIKKIDDTFKRVPVSQLTWQLGGGEDDEIGRKRRGVFPNPMSPRKKKAVSPPISGGYNDTQMDQRIPLSSIQTAERQSNTEEKRRHLQNSSINSMTDEYDTEEELQSVLKREAATRVTVKFAEDCYIEDDSSELSYAAYWTKQKAIPKMNSTFNGLDDSEYESANTDEIITVAKTLQKRCDHIKTKSETVKVEEFNQIKIQKCKEGSTFSHGTKDECKSMNIEMNNSESDSETGASENDSSSFFSDEEYKAMMQNCLKLGLTIRDLETLVKEANEFENNADDKTKNDGECDNDDINSKHGYGVAENPLASGSKIPTLEKKQNARLVSGIKKKLNTENLQRVLESGSQNNGDESDSRDSDFEKHYEPININSHRENVKTEALKPKSPVALQCLVNHELKKRAQGKKGETNKDWYPGFENIKAKRGLEPDDIVASILEGDGISDQQSFPKKKIDTPVKPPAFKGLSSVSASAAKANSVFGSSTISSVENAAVTKISNVLKQSSYGSKQTKQAERPEPSRDSKLVFLEAKSKIRSSSSDSEKCNSGLCCTSSSFAKPSISQIDAAKEKTTIEVKQKQDNQKRLVAMMERRKELELQKQIIQGALLELDSKCSKKSQHFVFNSDSASDEEASTSEKKSMFAHNNANQSTSKLFNSSEEDSDNDEKEDNERFEIKAQYEGRSGMKLMQLQSRFGTDDRFKMDSRFLESSSEDEPSEPHNSKVDEEYDLSAEKKKNLGILQSILNINVEPQPARKQTAKGKKFKDLNSLHFDPEKKDHATFETKAEERESKSERMKKQLEAERLPDVSKETFHEISMDFREVFGASKTQKTKGAKTTWDQVVEPEKKEAQKSRSSELFSLQSKNIEEPVKFTFSFFGNTTEERISNSEPYKTKTIKPAKVAWQEDPRFQDSSSEEDNEETTVAIENKTSTQPDISTIRFFFVKDDERLKTGPTMFFWSSNTEQEAEVWEQKKDILLEECRKRHKDAKRKTKAKH